MGGRQLGTWERCIALLPLGLYTGCSCGGWVGAPSEMEEEEIEEEIEEEEEEDLPQAHSVFIHVGERGQAGCLRLIRVEKVGNEESADRVDPFTHIRAVCLGGWVGGWVVNN